MERSFSKATLLAGIVRYVGLPLVHMVWSTKEGFSPWRYAGWGCITIEPRCVIDVVLEGPNVRRADKLERLADVSGIDVSEVLLFDGAVRVFRRGDLDIRQIEFDDLCGRRIKCTHSVSCAS